MFECERASPAFGHPSLVTDAEVAWYLNKAIFLVSEDDEGV